MTHMGLMPVETFTNCLKIHIKTIKLCLEIPHETPSINDQIMFVIIPSFDHENFTKN